MEKLFAVDLVFYEIIKNFRLVTIYELRNVCSLWRNAVDKHFAGMKALYMTDGFPTNYFSSADLGREIRYRRHQYKRLGMINNSGLDEIIKNQISVEEFWRTPEMLRSIFKLSLNLKRLYIEEEYQDGKLFRKVHDFLYSLREYLPRLIIHYVVGPSGYNPETVKVSIFFKDFEWNLEDFEEIFKENFSLLKKFNRLYFHYLPHIKYYESFTEPEFCRNAAIFSKRVKFEFHIFCDMPHLNDFDKLDVSKLFLFLSY